MLALLEANWLSACSVGWLRVVLDATCKGLVILAAGGALSLALRRSSAAARHLVWVLAIGALISLPVLSAVLPGWQVPHLPRWEIAGEAPVESAPVAGDGRAADHGRFRVGPLTGPAEPRQDPAPALGVMPRAETIEETMPIPAIRATEDTRPLHWSAWVLLAWAAGALVVLAPLMVGTVKVWRLARRAGSISDGSWRRLLVRLSGGLGLRRAVRLLRSDRPVVPASWGLWRPVVLLPACADDWPAGRRRVVLVHELAHVKRWDCLTQLLAQIACAAYWFNPLAWLAARMLRLERERACDDLVLAAGSRPSDYAGHLLEIVRSARLLTAPSLAAVSMARRFGLEGRLRAILDAGRDRRTLTRLAVVVALAAVACVVVPLAAMRPGEQAQAAPAAKAEAKPATQPEESPKEVAGAFLRALASGQDEKAKGMTRPDNVKSEDFPKFREWFDLSEVRIEQLLISKEDACVVTSALPGRKGARTVHMGLALMKHGDRWLVRDVDALPSKKAISAFVEDFKKTFPDFKMETPPTPPTTRPRPQAGGIRLSGREYSLTPPRPPI